MVGFPYTALTLVNVHTSHYSEESGRKAAPGGATNAVIRGPDREEPSAMANPDVPPAWWAPFADEFPCWHAWTGVAGLLYARLPRSSPPVVVRAVTAGSVAEQIRAWYRRRR